MAVVGEFSYLVGGGGELGSVLPSVPFVKVVVVEKFHQDKIYGSSGGKKRPDC